MAPPEASGGVTALRLVAAGEVAGGSSSSSSKAPPGVEAAAVLDGGGGPRGDATGPLSSPRCFAGLASGEVVELAARAGGGVAELGRVGATKKAPDALVALDAVGALVVLSDGNLALLDAGGGGLKAAGRVDRAKGAHVLAPGPAGGARFAAGVKRRLLLFEARRDAATGALSTAVLHDFELPDVARAAAWVADAAAVVATKRAYLRLNVESGEAAEVCATPDGAAPILAPLHFLPERAVLATTATGSLGVVLDAERGVPLGGTLALRAAPASVACAPPYVVTCVGATAEVHAPHSAARVQALPLPFTVAAANGRWPPTLAAAASGGALVAFAGRKVCILAPVPAEEQARELLQAGAYDAAVELAAALRAPWVAEVHAEAAFLLLGALRFERAAHHLLACGSLEPAELFPLFPQHAGPWRGSAVVRRYWGLHPPARDVAEMVDAALADGRRGVGDATECVRDAKLWVAHFLVRVRELPGRVPEAQREGTDSLLALLLVELGRAEELEALAAGPNAVRVSYVVGAFEATGRHHALALLHRGAGDVERATATWERLASGAAAEAPAHDGAVAAAGGAAAGAVRVAIAHAVETLSPSADTELVLRHAEWLVSKAPDKALAMLTSAERAAPLPAERVLELLRPRSQRVLVQFLEHIVGDPRSSSAHPAHHTELAVALLERAIATGRPRRQSATRAPSGSVGAGVDAAPVSQERVRLRAFLEESERYDAHEVLARARGTDLWEEQALLCRRASDHRGALELIALRIGDFAAAEDYCAALEPMEAAQDAYMELLDLYLRPGEGREPLLARAARLIAGHRASLDPTRVLDALRPDMPLALVMDTLAHMMRDRAHRRHEAQMGRALARRTHQLVAEERAEERARFVALSDGRSCRVCHSRLARGGEFRPFGLLPNGSMACYKCTVASSAGPRR